MMARFACLNFLFGFAAFATAIKFLEEEEAPCIRDVEYARGLINCPNGVQHDDNGTCEEMALLLDIYPAFATANEPGPKFPAILIAHGGANREGSKRTRDQRKRATTYARKGFVVFVADYRVESDHGTYPGIDFKFSLSTWRSLYPAVRDLKAAVRFIRARGTEYGVDHHRIVASGTSAGGMDVLAAFTSSRSAFLKELSMDDDPTLNTSYMEYSPKVRAMVVHSGPPWGIQQHAQYLEEQSGPAGFAPAWMSIQEHRMLSFMNTVPPLIQFHSENDTLINVANAKVTQDMYAESGANSTLRILEGTGHCDWSYGCHIKSGYYCPVLDHEAIDFIYAVGFRWTPHSAVTPVHAAPHEEIDAIGFEFNA